MHQKHMHLGKKLNYDRSYISATLIRHWSPLPFLFLFSENDTNLWVGVRVCVCVCYKVGFPHFSLSLLLQSKLQGEEDEEPHYIQLLCPNIEHKEKQFSLKWISSKFLADFWKKTKMVTRQYAISLVLIGIHSSFS